MGYLASSSDGGQTWSAPLRLPVAQPFTLSLAASARGDLYLAAADGDNNRLVILRSRDGGKTFSRARVISDFASPYDEECEGAFLPPQTQFCIPPSVHVVVDNSGAVVVGWADVVVATCDDACPVIPGKRYVNWHLPDPKGRLLDEVRELRDEIESRVERLVTELDHDAHPNRPVT